MCDGSQCEPLLILELHVCMHRYTPVRACRHHARERQVSADACVRMCVCVSMYVFLSVFVCMCVCVCMCVWVYGSVRVCVRVCAGAWCVYI